MGKGEITHTRVNVHEINSVLPGPRKWKRKERILMMIYIFEKESPHLMLIILFFHE